jgi:hypothetical protein
LRADIDRCDRFQHLQVNHFDCAWLRADAFDRDENVAVIRRDYRAVNNLSLCGNPSQFRAARWIED